METKSLYQKISQSVFAGSALLALIFQILAVMLNWETGSHYFQANAILPPLAVALALISMIAGTVNAFLQSKTDNKLPKALFGSNYDFLPALLGYIATAALLFFSAEGRLVTVTALMAILGACFAGFYLISKTDNALCPFCGFGAILACAFLIAYYYFDSAIEMNAPYKVLVQCGLLFPMLTITGELRYVLEKPLPRFTQMLYAWAISIGTICTLPTMIAFFMGKIDRIDFFAGSLLSTALSVTCLLRFISMKRAIYATSVEEPTAPSNDGAEPGSEADREGADQV